MSEKNVNQEKKKVIIDIDEFKHRVEKVKKEKALQRVLKQSEKLRW